ncbi:MAG TPA: nucleotidyltransferase domain-containing protein, partial [Acidimicrobiales bacterium]
LNGSCLPTPLCFTRDSEATRTWTGVVASDSAAFGKEDQRNGAQTMDPRLRSLHALGTSIANSYRDTAAAAILCGSVRRGTPDEYSDVDLTILYETVTGVAAAHTRRPASAVLLRQQESDSYGIVETFVVERTRVDVHHLPLATARRDVQAVVAADTAAALNDQRQGLCAELAEADAIFGGSVVEELRRPLRPYPARLGVAMIKAHAELPGRWMLVRDLQRDDLAAFYRGVIEIERRLLGLLLGLNRVYHPPNLKAIAQVCVAFRAAPLDLASRLQRALSDPPRFGLATLDSLVAETASLEGAPTAEFKRTAATYFAIPDWVMGSDAP